MGTPMWEQLVVFEKYAIYFGSYGLTRLILCILEFVVQVVCIIMGGL